MDFRLTLEERNQLAVQLRDYLYRDDPVHLEAAYDESITSYNALAEAIAFEEILDLIRTKMTPPAVQMTEENAIYDVVYTYGSLRKREITPITHQKLVRIGLGLAQSAHLEPTCEALADKWSECGIERYKLKLLIFELAFEIEREFHDEYARKYLAKKE